MSIQPSSEAFGMSPCRPEISQSAMISGVDHDHTRMLHTDKWYEEKGSAQEQVDLCIKSKDSEALKRLLMDVSPKIKGRLFEYAMQRLYALNGWVSRNVGGAHDKGADVLLSNPESPNKTSFIVQAKNQNKPLDIDSVRSEYVKFEQEGSHEFQCQNFKIVSVSGFTKSAIKKLRGFNVDLCDWTYVAKLVRDAGSEWVHKSPTIELSASNRETYKRIQHLWERSNRVAAVQATGTGKSYLIAKAIIENQSGGVLVLAPRVQTIKRQLKKTPWIDGIQTSTYHSLSIQPDKFDTQPFDLIVLDEFHRIGAPEWQASVEKLLDSNPQAKVLGTSATHIRYLDRCRNMADEIFGGHVVFGPNLPEAIATRILPNPTYISAFYTLDQEISQARDTILSKSLGPEQQRNLLNKLSKLHSHWSASKQVSMIVRNHLRPGANKFIVFCESISHLNYMESQVSLWFKEGLSSPQRPYIKVKNHIVHSTQGSAANDEELRQFEFSEPGDSEVSLLFTVDMLNESLHIKDVDGVFLLRKTTSPVVYLQQIGRTLACDGCRKPIIFDLVDNGNNIKHADFKEDIEKASKNYNERRKAAGLPYLDPVSVVVHDYASETSDQIKDMLHVFDPWESRFQQLRQYYVDNGHCNIPQRESTLGKWVNRQRILYSKGALSEDRVHKLSSLKGFQWSAVSDFADQMLAYLKGEFLETGYCPYKTGDPDADRWMESMRRMYRGNTLSEERLKELNSINFVWSYYDFVWDEKYKQLKAYFDTHGHCNVPKSDPALGRWVRAQRDKANHLSQNRKSKLDAIGFRWR